VRDCGRAVGWHVGYTQWGVGRITWRVDTESIGAFEL
jgi:hypothetical protein